LPLLPEAQRSESVADPMVDDVRPLARFERDKMGKATLFAGAGMMVGLNAFEAGQEHAAHAHAGTDKLYHVVEGRGEFTVGEAKRTLERGAVVFAPAGVPHGVRNVGAGRLIVLVVMGPPPAAR
jgi:quercetin dioxygenase-like cupin family protein